MSPPSPGAISRFGRRLLLAVAAGAILFAGLRTGTGGGLVRHAKGEQNPFNRGPFLPHAYFANDSDLPVGVQARGSYVQGDRFTGRFLSGWYEAPAHVALMVCGYPHTAGNHLSLEVRLKDGQAARVEFAHDDPREGWVRWDVLLPAGAEAFRIDAVDGSAAQYGWLGVSEPVSVALVAGLEGAPSPVGFMVGLLVQAALLLALALAGSSLLGRWVSGPAGSEAFVPLVATAALAYVAFWVYFWSAPAGRLLSWVGLSAALLWAIRSLGRSSEAQTLVVRLAGLALAVGLGFAGLTCLFKQAHFSDLAVVRYQRDLGVDNLISQIFAGRLWAGYSPKKLAGDWLSSDRPPLQTGWILLFEPVLSGLGLDADTAGQVSCLCFQLAWVPSLWFLCRRLKASARLADAVVAAVAFTGFALFHSIFAWPKLSGAGLVVGAFVLWFTPGEVSVRRRWFFVAGVAAALGWLSHGGVAFSLLGLAPIVLYQVIRGPAVWPLWAWSSVAFLALALPWMTYQRVYEPPGNRLLKWHLAGVVDAKDHRPFLETLTDSYGKIGWQGALQVRQSNWNLQWAGDWTRFLLFQPPPDVIDRRWDETEDTFRSFGWWILAAPLVCVFLVPTRRTDPFPRLLALWWLLGWALAVVMLFKATQATVHQGTMITQLAGFALLTWAVARVGRWAFLAVALLQVAGFLCTWIAPTLPAEAPMNRLAGLLALGSGLWLLGRIAAYVRHPGPEPAGC